MKRIGLFLDSVPENGGKYQYSHSLLDAALGLERNNFELLIVYSSRNWEPYLNGCAVPTMFFPNSLLKRLMDRAFMHLPLPRFFMNTCYSMLIKEVRDIHKRGCDLWIFSTENRLSYQLGLPSLVPIFDLMHRYETRFPEVSKYGRGRRRDKVYANICKVARGLLVDSTVGKQHVIESYGVKGDRIYVLPYVPPKKLYADEGIRESDLTRALPEKYIFYPAQFWEHKNHKTLIQAVSLLRTRLVDLRLVLTGTKKNAYGAVNKLINDLDLRDHVIFLGHVDSRTMPLLYQRARAMIMPTFFGPTNIPPLEAFLYGCPVACSNIYSMPEQIGDAGLLFNPHSKQEISAAIHRLWVDDQLCAELSARGRIKAEKWGQCQFNHRLRQVVCDALDLPRPEQKI